MLMRRPFVLSSSMTGMHSSTSGALRRGQQAVAEHELAHVDRDRLGIAFNPLHERGAVLQRLPLIVRPLVLFADVARHFDN